MRLVADLVGLDVAIALIRAFGGTRIYVSRSSERLFKQYIDQTYCEKLIEALNGTRLWVPSPHQVFRQVAKRLRPHLDLYTLSTIFHLSHYELTTT